MYDPAVLRFALVSGLLGFAAFCLSYALLVWRRRNRLAADPHASLSHTLRRGSSCLALAGILAAGVAVAVRELNRAEGILSSDGLYAIRMPDDEYRVTYLMEAEQVKQGDLVARLESPAAEAQVQRLELQCQRLEKERGALEMQALELDRELVRHHQNAITAGNQLRASIGQLLPEHESVTRQAIMERLERCERLAKLKVDIAWQQGELARARSRRDFIASELERAVQLVDRNAVAQSEVDARREQRRDVDAEVSNLEQRIEGMRQEKDQLERSLREINEVAAGQRQTLLAELELARCDYASLKDQAPDWSAKLEKDLERARHLRQRELDQLELKIRECRAEAAGLNKTLHLCAPFDGTVVYRNPSPRSADRNQPLFVLAQHPGFRLQVRLPRTQLSALETAGDITIELIDQSVEPYFGGTFLTARPLPRKPQYVVAELACCPPKEAVRALMDGDRVLARLHWRPPFASLWMFRIGAGISLVGLAGWFIGLLGHLRRPVPDEPVDPHAPRPQTPAGHDRTPTSAIYCAAPVNGTRANLQELEAGSVAAIHELLGERLREALLRDDFDGDLLSAVQWALDRHHARAVRQLRLGLSRDEVIEERVRQLRAEMVSSTGNGSAKRERERMLDVLTAIDPHLIEWNSHKWTVRS